MRLQTCTPAVTPRGRPRQTMKTPYSRVNAIKKLHPGLQEIVKNCPALDIIFDHDSPRSSTHSRSRGRDKEHVARPPNAFMVYRSYVWYTKQLENKDEKNLSCVSRLAGRSWRVLSEQARTPFKQVATIAKREHAERNPDYKYAPSSRPPKSQRKPGRAGSRAKGKAKVKQTATPLVGGFDASPPPNEVTPIPSAASLTDVPPASSESSPFPSSPSSPSPSTPSALSPRRLTRWMSPSPQLEYPSDCDLPDYPPRPRFRPTMLGLIPSPSMSILELNEDEQPYILDQLPEKYDEAESYHNLPPHALLFNEEIPFDGADHNTRISLFARTESIDYSSFISGNPEVKLGSPPSPTCVLDLPSSILSLGPSTSTVIDDGFNSPLSSTRNWSVFDMPTLGSDHALYDTNVFGPNDSEIFDALVTCGGY